MIWLDIESNPSDGCDWSGDIDANCGFLDELVKAVRNNGRVPGIYASRHFWQVIFGSPDNCAWFYDIPLWYAHYDGEDNYNDWVPFGGWSRPAMKQYQGTSYLCGAGVDYSFW